MTAFLFRHRGRILAGPLLVVLLVAEPEVPRFWAGLSGVILGLAVRVWSITYIGPAARTVDPRPPPGRVTRGPYRLGHPLYMANLWIATCWAVAAGLSATAVGGVIFAVGTFYAALALREWRHSRHLPVDDRPRITLRAALRIERSTFLTMSVAGVLMAVAMVT